MILVSHDRDFLDRVATSVLHSDGDGVWTEYAGGYSDMLAQKRAPALVAETKSRPSPAALPTISGPAKKLSFKDKHALETLPGQISTLQADIDALTARIADASFYRRDPAGFATATAGLSKAEAKLAAAEERWLELEILREDVEVR